MNEGRKERKNRQQAGGKKGRQAGRKIGGKKVVKQGKGRCTPTSIQHGRGNKQEEEERREGGRERDGGRERGREGEITVNILFCAGKERKKTKEKKDGKGGRRAG